MFSTEFDGVKKLRDQLDQSLLARAAELCGTAPSIRSVYELQGLAEVHCYLKTMHNITPHEADALLRFADPLTVAHACWEENPHTYSFPICKLLKEISAEKRFPLAGGDRDVTRGKQSVQEQLRTAMAEARSNAASKGHSRSDGTR